MNHASFIQSSLRDEGRLLGDWKPSDESLGYSQLPLRGKRVCPRHSMAQKRLRRDIEQGRDVKLSNLQSVAAVLALELELIKQGG